MNVPCFVRLLELEAESTGSSAKLRSRYVDSDKTSTFHIKGSGSNYLSQLLTAASPRWWKAVGDGSCNGIFATFHVRPRLCYWILALCITYNWGVNQQVRILLCLSLSRCLSSEHTKILKTGWTGWDLLYLWLTSVSKCFDFRIRIFPFAGLQI